MVAEGAVTFAVYLYSTGSLLKDAVSVTDLLVNHGNGSGHTLGKLNGLLLNNVPEGTLRNAVEHVLEKAEQQGG